MLIFVGHGVSFDGGGDRFDSSEVIVILTVVVPWYDVLSCHVDFLQQTHCDIDDGVDLCVCERG